MATLRVFQTHIKCTDAGTCALRCWQHFNVCVLQTHAGFEHRSRPSANVMQNTPCLSSNRLHSASAASTCAAPSGDFTQSENTGAQPLRTHCPSS